MRTDRARRLAAFLAQLGADDRDLIFRLTDRRFAASVRRVERDRLITEAAARFFGEASSRSDRARQLSLAIARYTASTWRQDRSRRHSPHRPNTLRAALFQILVAGDGRSLSAERIRKLLVTDPVC